MELPRQEIEQVWGGGRNVFVLGSAETARLTVLSQQRRALNLIYALSAEGRIGPSSRIAIVGAGPAGLTAAKAAAHIGAKVKVLEQSTRPMNTFCPLASDGMLGNPTRLVHPGLEYWPNHGWQNREAVLPMMGWSAGPPESVAKQIALAFDEVDPFADAGAPEVYIDVGCRIFYGPDPQCEDDRTRRAWRISGHGRAFKTLGTFFTTQPTERKDVPWQVERLPFEETIVVNGKPEKHRLILADILIFAVGFGADTHAESGLGLKGSGSDELVSNGYWNKNSRANSVLKTVKSRVVVSGDGDGALIDAINAYLWTEDNEGYPTVQEELVRALTLIDASPNLRSCLIRIEDRISRQALSAHEIRTSYRYMLAPVEADRRTDRRAYLNEAGIKEFEAFIEALKKLRGKSRKHRVQIVCPGDSPYRPDALALNRFIVFSLLQLEHDAVRTKTQPEPAFSFEIGKVVGGERINHHLSLSIGDDRRDGIARQPRSLDNCAFWYARHGPVAALGKNFPEIWAGTLRTLRPRNALDQTREQAWPDGFFSIPRASKRVISHARMKFSRVVLEAVVSPYQTAFPKRRSYEEKNTEWVNVACIFTYEFASDCEIGSELLMEHFAAHSHRVNLRLVSVDRRNSEAIRDEHLPGNPSWAIAYWIKNVGESTAKVHVEASPSGPQWLSDAIGFRVFSNLDLGELLINVRFEGLCPQIAVRNTDTGEVSYQHGLARYSEPLRRIGYEEGIGQPIVAKDLQEVTPLESSATVDGVTDSGPQLNVHTCTASFVPGDMSKGYFHGLCWHRLVTDKVAAVAIG